MGEKGIILAHTLLIFEGSLGKNLDAAYFPTDVFIYSQFSFIAQEWRPQWAGPGYPTSINPQDNPQQTCPQATDLGNFLVGIPLGDSQLYSADS